MNSADTIDQRKRIIIILWGLVFAKCLTLEYLIQVYSVPINSFFYIWALTLAMASAATITFLRTRMIEIDRPGTVSIVHLIWGGCFIASLLLIGIFSLLTKLNVYTVPTILSIILGIGYTSHGLLIGKNAYILSGIGWWIGAAVLGTRNNVESLSILAFLVIFLSVLPPIIEIQRQRKTLTSDYNQA